MDAVDNEAYRVDIWDVDGRNVEQSFYYPTLAIARREGIEFTRRYSMSWVKLYRMTWVGVNRDDCHMTPVKAEELPMIDHEDPDVAEYLRLKGKFDRIPNHLFINET